MQKQYNNLININVNGNQVRIHDVNMVIQGNQLIYSTDENNNFIRADECIAPTMLTISCTLFNEHAKAMIKAIADGVA